MAAGHYGDEYFQAINCNGIDGNRREQNYYNKKPKIILKNTEY